MNKKPSVKPSIKPISIPVKPVVVIPPTPTVWTLLDLPINCTRFDTNQFASHAGAIVSIFAGTTNLQDITYGLGHINIVPPVGTWKEQSSPDAINYRDTGITLKQIQVGVNNTTSINLTLDGGIGPKMLMRYLKV